MNLAAYEEVLETALSVTQPMDGLLDSLEGASALTLESCRRLAYHAWSEDRIVAAAKSVIHEIEGADWSARTQRTIDRLESSLAEWNADGDHDAALAEIRSAMLEVCGAVEYEAAATCEGFLEQGA
jgi:hypothetical protein